MIINRCQKNSKILRRGRPATMGGHVADGFMPILFKRKLQLKDIFEFGLLVFTSLFTVVNPFGVIPVYLTMTATLSNAERKKVARKASITSVITLILFALTGNLLFHFFNISIHALRVVGGVLFFIVGFDMIGGRMARIKDEKESLKDYSDDISVTPLAIPMITGPGAMTIAIIMKQKANGIMMNVAFYSAILLVFLLTYLFLLSGQRITRMIGPSGTKVFMKIMGIIVMMVAVELFFAGLQVYVQNMIART